MPQDAANSLVSALGWPLALLVVTALALLFGAGRLFEAWLKRRLQAEAERSIQNAAREHTAQLNRELENHRATLALAAEATRFSLQRHLHEFTIFVEERHKVYREAYRLILEAQGHLSKFYGVQWANTYEDCNRSDLEELLRERKAPGGATEKVLDSWDSGKRADAIKLLSEVMSNFDKYDAFKAIQEANNYILLNELHLSSVAAEAAQNATDAMHDYSAFVRWPDRDSREPERAAKVKMDEAVRAVRRVFKADIERAEIATSTTPVPDPRAT